MHELLLTIGQAAKLLGITDHCVRKACKRGLMVCQLTDGGHRRFTVKEVARFNRKMKQLRSWGLLDF